MTIFFGGGYKSQVYIPWVRPWGWPGWIGLGGWFKY